MELTVDGQRTAIAALHQLAHESAGGRWIAYGGGGYGLVRCVPRTWTHLLAEATGEPVPANTAVPAEWTEHLRGRGVTGPLPATMGEAVVPPLDPWQPGGEGWLDGAIAATRRAVYPLHGLDPDDPRD
jgi:acetoin utilization protein AcuC